MADFGVINEQGYPAGQFGFVPVSESEKKSVEEAEKKKKKEEQNKK